MRGRHGSTLIELMVTMAIMAIVAAVVTLATRSAAATADPEVDIVQARRRALASGRAVTVVIHSHDRRAPVTLLPDGGIVADSGLGLHRLTGVVPR